MPLPVTFATLTQGSEPAALLDTQFAALGVLVHIPCTAVGQNAVLLTVANNTPFTGTYTNLSPAFVWVQQQTSTGNVTLGVAGGPATLQAYRNNGQTAMGSGDLVAGAAYSAFYVSTLNSGAGGFVVDAFSTVVSGGILITKVGYSGSQTITIPANATKADVQMWGATGGTGGVSNGSSGGTGAGGYLEALFIGLTPGNTLIYTQGGAGAAGLGTPGNGGNGGVTTLASGTQTIATMTCSASNGSLAASGTTGVGTIGGTATGSGSFPIMGQSGGGGTAMQGGVGGRNVYSNGADGVQSAGTSAGNIGSTGGLTISWYS